MSSLRGGAGLVTLAVPTSSLDVVAGIEPSYMTIPLACDDEGRIVVLINEKAISQSEHTCLFFAAAFDDVTFVGSPTNGANGDVSIDEQAVYGVHVGLL